MNSLLTVKVTQNRGNESGESATKTASEATVPDLATQSATIKLESSNSQTGQSGSYRIKYSFLKGFIHQYDRSTSKAEAEIWECHIETINSFL